MPTAEPAFDALLQDGSIPARRTEYGEYVSIVMYGILRGGVVYWCGG